jgi:hypothetical protein
MKKKKLTDFLTHYSSIPASQSSRVPDYYFPFDRCLSACLVPTLPVRGDYAN